MKTSAPFFPTIAGIIILFWLATCPVQARIIFSTTTGGNWNVVTTWVGGIIPQSTDTVIITTGATVSTILGTYNNCLELEVQSGAFLLNGGSSAATLTVLRGVTNHGTIRNGNGLLTLIVNGDLIHQGAEWSNYKVALQPGTSHTVTFGEDKLFSGSYFAVEGTARTVYSPSSLRFNGTIVDFNQSELQFTADSCTLSLTGQSLYDIRVMGAGNMLSMRGGAVIYNATLYSSTLTDTIRTGSNNFYLEDSLVIAPSAVLMNYGSAHTVYVNGSVTNRGTVTNGANLLTVYITGGLYHHGIWENYATYLSGSSDQFIYQAPGTCFSGTYFYNINTTTKTVYAMSDLDFRGMIINFAANMPGGIRGNLVLPDGGWLKVAGNWNNLSLSRMNLGSSGNEATLMTTSGIYTQSFSNSCNILWLRGTVQVGNNEFYLLNEVRVADSLVNYSSSTHTAYITGLLRNLGYIRNGTGLLEVNITGDVVHEGMEWSNYRVILAGTVPRSVTQGPFSAFACTYFESAGALEITVPSGLQFDQTKLNLFYSNLTFPSGSTLAVNGSAARLVNANIFGDIHLGMTGGAYLQSVVFNGNTRMTGLVPVYNNGVVFNGAVINESDLQNQNSSTHTLYLNGDLRNTGSVTNGIGLFILELRGNITNDGLWTNFENRLNGTSDQHIRLTGDQPVNARVILVSNLGGSNFQWHKNGIPIFGATSANLTLNQVTTAGYGVYQCTSSLGSSRLFTIATEPVAAFFLNPQDGCAPLPVTFTDNSTSWFPITGWSWDFGDDSMSDLQDPEHTYGEEGVYDVSLTITDGYISVLAAQSDAVVVRRVPQPDFIAGTAVFDDTTWFSDLTSGIFYDEGTMIQYAETVTGYSSQYTSGNWAAAKLLGPPDVYPAHEDNVNAWASLTANHQREFLSVKFPQATHACGVIVYETFYPGAVDSIYLKDLTTGQWVLVWTEPAAALPLVARALTAEFPRTSFLTNEVRVAVNSPAVAYWNEIDAIALVSPADTTISARTAYAWEMGSGGPVLHVKGDVGFRFPEPGVFTVTLTVTNDGQCTSEYAASVTVLPPPLVTWNGSHSDVWHETANWTPPWVPDNETDVIIPDVTPYHFPMIRSHAWCKNLTVRPAASLDAVNPAILTVFGDCTLEVQE